jgi:hypothetical protein
MRVSVVQSRIIGMTQHWVVTKSKQKYETKDVLIIHGYCANCGEEVDTDRELKLYNILGKCVECAPSPYNTWSLQFHYRYARDYAHAKKVIENWKQFPWVVDAYERKADHTCQYRWRIHIIGDPIEAFIQEQRNKGISHKVKFAPQTHPKIVSGV